jgi:MinD-like ATPase involved in chromosome partitioning or flagellar assembly
MFQREAVASVQRTLNGPRTIVVLNPKGGAHKTTATLLIAATFGTYRGGFTLAWDNNETMGTLGVRAQAAAHTNTAVDLLRDLERFGDGEARVGDLDGYVRAQGDAQFDALASDLDPAGAASIDAAAFGRLHSTLSRFYRVLVIDTGNNMRASNWEAAVDTADQLVIVSTIREDTGFGAAALIDGLRAKGHADKVAQAVTILASPSKTADPQLSRRLHDHFAQLTRTVLDVPFDASLVSGGPLNVDALAPRTRAAWLLATAAIAEGL